MSDMEPQSFPPESKCPECGGEPTEESKTKHRLQNLGYLADDGHPVCSDCGHLWRIGRPIGEYEDGDDLWCPSCDDAYMFVHFINILERAGTITYKLNTKCPNCYFYGTVKRESDSSGRALVGYPPITGSREGSRPVGRPE